MIKDKMVNAYTQYKRDQKLLVYWLVHASNTIIRRFPVTVPLNTTGEMSLSTLVTLSGLVAKHIKPQAVPATIYRLLRSVIDARKQTHSIVQQIVADKPDPNVRKATFPMRTK